MLVGSTLAATEAGDTLSASGTITSGVNGTLSVTEASDTGAASGTVLIQGIVNASESGSDTASILGDGVTVAVPTREIEWHVKRSYIKRGKQILVFDTPEQADAWLDAEQQASQAIAQAQSKSGKRRKLKKARQVLAALPTQAIELDSANSIIERMGLRVDWPRIEAKQDWAQYVAIAMRAQAMQTQQDEDDIEMLLLAM